MPSHRQFKKSIRKEAKAAMRNRAAKSRVNTLIKKVHAAATQEEGKEALSHTVSVIDTTARKGIIKKTTAARKKSRLYKFVANMT